mmetsp:Transcript_10114/g.29888  ORF Transcript_10114/g.29888 Transcript_10114/m.29888 type:complete len:741 (-) Transcript_10114:1445-3667(-)
MPWTSVHAETSPTQLLQPPEWGHFAHPHAATMWHLPCALQLRLTQHTQRMVKRNDELDLCWCPCPRARAAQAPAQAPAPHARAGMGTSTDPAHRSASPCVAYAGLVSAEVHMADATLSPRGDGQSDPTPGVAKAGWGTFLRGRMSRAWSTVAKAVSPARAVAAQALESHAEGVDMDTLDDAQEQTPAAMVGATTTAAHVPTAEHHGEQRRCLDAEERLKLARFHNQFHRQRGAGLTADYLTRRFNESRARRPAHFQPTWALPLVDALLPCLRSPDGLLSIKAYAQSLPSQFFPSSSMRAPGSSLSTGHPEVVRASSGAHPSCTDGTQASVPRIRPSRPNLLDHLSKRFDVVVLNFNLSPWCDIIAASVPGGCIPCVECDGRGGAHDTVPFSTCSRAPKVIMENNGRRSLLLSGGSKCQVCHATFLHADRNCLSKLEEFNLLEVTAAVPFSAAAAVGQIYVGKDLEQAIRAGITKQRGPKRVADDLNLLQSLDITNHLVAYVVRGQRWWRWLADHVGGDDADDSSPWGRLCARGQQDDGFILEARAEFLQFRNKADKLEVPPDGNWNGQDCFCLYQVNHALISDQFLDSFDENYQHVARELCNFRNPHGFYALDHTKDLGTSIGCAWAVGISNSIGEVAVQGVPSTALDHALPLVQSVGKRVGDGIAITIDNARASKGKVKDGSVEAKLTSSLRVKLLRQDIMHLEGRIRDTLRNQHPKFAQALWIMRRVRSKFECLPLCA